MTETLDTPIVGVFWDELIALRKILHAAERHPYFEYETTKGARKCLNEDESPEGENWTRNEDKGDKGFARFDFHDEAYWRRRKEPEAVKVDTDSGVITLSLTDSNRSIQISVAQHDVIVNRITGEMKFVRRSEDAGNSEVHL